MASKKRKWFQKGAFEDGYQFGNVLKTIVGTSADLKENLWTGIVGIGEKAVDSLVTIAPYMAEAQFNQNGGYYNPSNAKAFKQQNNSAKKLAADFVKKDLYDENKIAKKFTSELTNRVTGIDVEKESVLGEKSDSLVQSGGQFAGQLALQTAGVPWWLTTGVTTFGGEMENALKDRLNYKQATLNATIKTGAEILSEKLFGGSGFGEKGLINVEPLTKWISNKAIKTFADYGVDMLAEGAEEVFSEFMGNLGSSVYKKGKLKDILFSKEAAEGYLESFIGGAVLSGFANGGKASESIAERTDYRSGLTENEQKVFDRVYSETAIKTKAENSGNRLTRKQKAEIYDNALQQVKNGQVDTQNIEAALGGEEYSTYKNVLNNYEVLQQELNEIQARDNKVKTQEQATREIEIKNELERIKTKADNLKNILQNKVAEKIDVDNIRLKDRESYLWDSYVGKLPNFAKNNLNNVKTSQKIDYDAFVEGIWEDSPNTSKNTNSKNLTDDSISDNIEMFRKGSTHRRLSENNNFIIDKPTYYKITNPVIKQGADIRIANNEWLQRLKNKNASALTIGDVIFFREDATVSDVLEETYHFLQNKKGLNSQYNNKQRTILNEIDAKEYLLSMTERYHIPEAEVDLTRRQLAYYRKQMKELQERNEWND